jgi:hypothetical protein
MRGSWTPGRRTALRAIAGAGAAAGLTVAGLAAIGPAAAQPVEALHTLHIVDGRLPPDERLIEARKGDRLRLRVTSNLAGELHLHAYRLSVALVPGEPAELAFSAFATGRFRFEWHPSKAQGAPAEDHNAAPLATLEVRPP